MSAKSYIGEGSSQACRESLLRPRQEEFLCKRTRKIPCKDRNPPKSVLTINDSIREDTELWRENPLTYLTGSCKA